MAEKTDSLASFLALDEASMERLRKRIAQASCLLEIGAKVGKGLPEGSSGAAAAQVAEQLMALLDTPFSKILAEAWSRDAGIRALADGDKHPPDKVSLVPLADHTVTSSHQPFVELMMETIELGRVDFQLDVAVKVKGALIGVRDGRIMELRAGNTAAEVALSCAGVAIAKRDGELKLPGVVKFEEGIRIAPIVREEPPVPVVGT